MLFCASFLVGRKKPAVPLCVSKGETDKCKHLGGGAAVCTSFIVICITKSKNVVCLMDDAKLRTFPLQSFNSSIFQFSFLWCIYEICGRNGKPCHNCRKIPFFPPL